MSYSVITENEQIKQLKIVKKSKATGPDNIICELYGSFGNRKICLNILHKNAP